MTAHQHEEYEPASTVAARARGLLAERRMKQTELGMAMGITRSRINDRLTGVKDFDLNELPALASALDTSVEYLMGFTDVRESKNPRPEISDGGDSRVVRHQGLEPRTRWLSVCPPQQRLIGGPRPEAPAPAEEPAAQVVVSLADRRRTSNSAVRGSSGLATVTRIFGSAS